MIRRTTILFRDIFSMRPMDLQNKENKQRIKKRIRGRLLRLASFLMILSGIFTILASILLLMFFGTAEMVSELREQTGGDWIPYVCLGDFVTVLLGGIASLLEGGMAMRTDKHPDMILPVWYMSLLMVLMRALDIFFSVLQKQAAAQTRSDMISMLMSIAFFIIIESVRREAEEAGEDIY